MSLTKITSILIILSVLCVIQETEQKPPNLPPAFQLKGNYEYQEYVDSIMHAESTASLILTRKNTTATWSYWDGYLNWVLRGQQQQLSYADLSVCNGNISSYYTYFTNNTCYGSCCYGTPGDYYFPYNSDQYWTNMKMILERSLRKVSHRTEMLLAIAEKLVSIGRLEDATQLLAQLSLEVDDNSCGCSESNSITLFELLPWLMEERGDCSYQGQNGILWSVFLSYPLPRWDMQETINATYCSSESTGYPLFFIQTTLDQENSSNIKQVSKESLYINSFEPSYIPIVFEEIPSACGCEK